MLHWKTKMCIFTFFFFLSNIRKQKIVFLPFFSFHPTLESNNLYFYLFVLSSIIKKQKLVFRPFFFHPTTENKKLYFYLFFLFINYHITKICIFTLFLFIQYYCMSDHSPFAENLDYTNWTNQRDIKASLLFFQYFLYVYATFS